jgi:murein DD-endopeptidase MepM/ murein hydrolase activator NlpD
MKTFQIFYPVKPMFVTQKFGSTALLSYYKENGIIFKGHNGMDIATAYGSPIRAAHDGIAYYEVDNSQGHGVVIRSSEMFEYEGKEVYFKTVYWHMIEDTNIKYKSPVAAYRDLTKMGMPVKVGDIIGYADSTGLSTGNHLHFGLKPCLPGEPDWMLVNVEQDNGYKGAIDPEPYFNGVYAEDMVIAQQNPATPFNKDIKLYETGDEVKKLQEFLKKLGYFPQSQACTGYYGTVTRNSVFNFQQNSVKLSPWEYFIMKGSKVGEKTRLALNSLMQK